MGLLMICAFCQREVEASSALGWRHDFWAGGVNYEGPVCPECCQRYLETAENGEHVLKPGCVVPPGTAPSVEIEPPELHTRQKFPLGEIVATPESLRCIDDAGQTPDFFLDRHAQGDWGAVADEDWRANDEALVNGDRIVSAYRTLRNVRIWIVSEADRSATIIILPEQY
jgi:hypothetical protein